jgi:hypothetical protein
MAFRGRGYRKSDSGAECPSSQEGAIDMPKVTMSLTDVDAENAEFIRRETHARSKAHALSIALTLTRFAIDLLKKSGSELAVRNSDGNFDRVVMPDLQNIRRHETQAAP